MELVDVLKLKKIVTEIESRITLCEKELIYVKNCELAVFGSEEERKLARMAAATAVSKYRHVRHLIVSEFPAEFPSEFPAFFVP